MNDKMKIKIIRWGISSKLDILNFPYFSLLLPPFVILVPTLGAWRGFLLIAGILNMLLNRSGKFRIYLSDSGDHCLLAVLQIQVLPCFYRQWFHVVIWCFFSWLVGNHTLSCHVNLVLFIRLEEGELKLDVSVRIRDWRFVMLSRNWVVIMVVPSNNLSCQQVICWDWNNNRVDIRLVP